MSEKKQVKSPSIISPPPPPPPFVRIGGGRGRDRRSVKCIYSVEVLHVKSLSPWVKDDVLNFFI